mgnify:CR=1 FL=1
MIAKKLAETAKKIVKSKSFKKLAIGTGIILSPFIVDEISPELKYSAFNKVSERVEQLQKKELTEEEIHRQELMKTGNEDLDALVKAYVENCELLNELLQNKNMSKWKREYVSFVNQAKRRKFYEADKALNTGFKEAFETRDFDDKFIPLGFTVFLGRACFSRDNTDCVTFKEFGRVVRLEKGNVYREGEEEVKYDLIVYEPIVPRPLRTAMAYPDHSRLAPREANPKVKVILPEVRWAALLLEQHNNSIRTGLSQKYRPDGKLHFQDLMAVRLYSILEEKAIAEAEKFCSAKECSPEEHSDKMREAYNEIYLETFLSAVGRIHEPSHILNPMLEYPYNEYKSELETIIKCEKPEEAYLALYQISTHFLKTNHPILTPDFEKKVLSSDFEGIKQAAKEKLEELGL